MAALPKAAFFYFWKQSLNALADAGKVQSFARCQYEGGLIEEMRAVPHQGIDVRTDLELTAVEPARKTDHVRSRTPEEADFCPRVQ